MLNRRGARGHVTVQMCLDCMLRAGAVISGKIFLAGTRSYAGQRSVQRFSPEKLTLPSPVLSGRAVHVQGNSRFCRHAQVTVHEGQTHVGRADEKRVFFIRRQQPSRIPKPETRNQGSRAYLPGTFCIHVCSGPSHVSASQTGFPNRLLNARVLQNALQASQSRVAKPCRGGTLPCLPPGYCLRKACLQSAKGSGKMPGMLPVALAWARRSLMSRSRTV